MPIYSFRCAACGEFAELRPMDRAGQPAHCPACGSLSTRILTAPHVPRMSAAVRRAHERNEASAHEPRVVRRGDL